MRFILDCMTVVSFTVAAAIIAGGAYVYTNKYALIDKARERATEEITNAVGEAITGAIGGLGTSVTPDLDLPVQPPTGFNPPRSPF